MKREDQNQPIWQPNPAYAANSHMTQLIAEVRKAYGTECDTYAELYQWSISQPDRFWERVWAYCGIRAETPYQAVSQSVPNPAHFMLRKKWFPGARLNFAENLLRFNDSREAIVFISETGERRALSYQELRSQVAATQSFLISQGVTVGDRVAGLMPNIPETVVAMLAATSLGAVWSSCSPDFGTNAILERFGQIAPKVLFACDGYYYNGKTIDIRERLSQIQEGLAELRTTVVVPFAQQSPDLTLLKNVTLFSACLSDSNHTLQFAQLPFDHPLYILYSSGTTGAPKCIVHGAGGTLIQHLKELVLHWDLRREDRVTYFTTCGWMMWNLLVSTLAVGATVVLYDGSPFFPSPQRLFDIADAEKLTVFGTSAKYLSSVEKTGLRPCETNHLSTLRLILSTGSPLLPSGFDFVYQSIKPDVQLSSISGGTDIISCFVLGNPLEPVYRGEIQCRGLGMHVQVYDEGGRPVRMKPGELVCAEPFPSMPIYFWNDPGGKKYLSSYFNYFDNVWRHGDWAELTKTNGVIIYGRSDAVLNPGGVRIGTSEIYRQVEQFEEIAESLAIGQQWQGDERIILFLKMQPNITLNDDLRGRVIERIRRETSPRHVPAKIIAVPDIPRTINGKIVELAVKNVVHNLPVKNLEALANPEALNYFKDLQELQS